MLQYNLKSLLHVATLVLGLSVLLGSYSALCSTTASSTFSSSGLLDYGTSPMANLLFSSNFESSYKVNYQRLNWGIDHLVNSRYTSLVNAWWDVVTAGTTRGVYTHVAHSGSKSMYLELTGSSPNRAIHLNINSGSLFIDKVFVRIWLYLPADFTMDSSWYEIGDPCYGFGDGSVSDRFYIRQSGDTFYWRTYNALVGSGAVLDWQYNNYTVPVPFGRWFKLEWYSVRDITNGREMIWVDDQLVFDVTGNTGLSTEDYATVIEKLYFDPGDSITHRIWADDLEIYDAIP